MLKIEKREELVHDRRKFKKIKRSDAEACV